YRELRNLTQEGLAQKLGISTTAYCRYEKGEYEPKMELWERIAEELEVPLMDLLMPDPMVIHMSNNQMAMPNFGSQNNQNFPTELFAKITEQFDARFAELQRSNQYFMDMIEKLMNERRS
ncbi:MAG: helix-turn-helix transcriptional regulator, partial [Bacteroidota bacterium]|nr:helix-turn-helix transcriptional regulator [Bacteroidota bacterium]